MTFSPKLTDVNIQDQVLWNNSLIKIDDNGVFRHNWIDIRHLLDEHGKFYSHMTFLKTYEVQCHFLDYYSLISALTKKWENGILQHQAETKSPQEELLHNLKKVFKVCKYVHKISVAKIRFSK